MLKYYVTQNNGDRELYKRSKLVASLKRAGTSAGTIKQIVTEVEKGLYDGISTSLIYKKAYFLLKNKQVATAARYSIRRSILNLGPSGFPFEKYIAQIWQAKGYKTKIGMNVSGKCARHEVDLIAYNDKEVIVGEIKFHNQLGVKTDTKTALYIKARFDDLIEQKFVLDGKKRAMTKSMMVTNTKFTHSAISYIKCSKDIDLVSWDYPEQGNLYDLIEETQIHPSTCVRELTKREKQELIKKGVVNCMQLKNHRKTMREIGVNENKINTIIDNIDKICSHQIVE